jgi:molybdopterin molybdotransferase
MITLDEALAKLLSSVAPMPAGQHEMRPTLSTLGHVLQQNVCSALDVPPFDNSAMDGYAVRCADVTAATATAAHGAQPLQITQRIAAGAPPLPLRPGTAARIFTGAPVPAGADAVVMQEQCEAQDGFVRIQATPHPGLCIRRRGEDVRCGDVVLHAGTRLTPQALGLAASVGAANLLVARRPRVALFSTGDELAMPGETLKPGAIYNSNRYTLHAAIQSAGCEATDYGIVPDQLPATRAALQQAAQNHDLIVTSGGVSVGEEDHLRAALQAEGSIDMWQIAIKPGKPFAFGTVRRPDGSSAYVAGLPGNPVASFLTFLLLVRPLLLRLQGAANCTHPHMQLRADFNWPRADKRREFLRVRRNAEGGLALFPNQSSGVLSSAVWADGVVDNPIGHTIQAGDIVNFLSFAELLA